MSLRVLFTHSYFLALDPKQAKAARPFPPLGTLYAAAAVRRAGHDVALFDTFFEPHGGTLDAALARFRPDLVVLHDDGFNWLTKMCLSVMEREALRMVSAARARGIPVVVAGSDATDHRGRFLDAGATGVLLGDTEETLVDLVAALDAGHGFDGIAGLARRVDGATVETGRRRATNLDALAPPAWDLVDPEPYRRCWREAHGAWSLNLVSSRGCPWGCAWCAKPLWGRQYVVASPERVVDDLATVRERFRPDGIWFADDIFGLTADWAKRFADEVERRAIRTPFMIQTRADLMVDEGLRRALVRAGLSTAWLGAESGSQKILDAMNKGLTVGETREAVNRLREEGVRVGLFLQYGYLGEEWDDIRATLEMLDELVPDEIGVSVSYPLPGTPFFEQVRGAMSTKTNWVDSDDLDPLHPGGRHPDWYRRLHRYTHHRFQAARGWRSLRELLGGSGLGDRERWRAAAAVGWHLPAAAVGGLLLGRPGGR